MLPLLNLKLFSDVGIVYDMSLHDGDIYVNQLQDNIGHTQALLGLLGELQYNFTALVPLAPADGSPDNATGVTRGGIVRTIEELVALISSVGDLSAELLSTQYTLVIALQQRREQLTMQGHVPINAQLWTFRVQSRVITSVSPLVDKVISLQGQARRLQHTYNRWTSSA